MEHKAEPFWLNAYNFMKGILECKVCHKKVIGDGTVSNPWRHK